MPRAHFPRLAPAVHDRITAEPIRFFDACAAAVMTPIRRDKLDDPAIRALLTNPGYAGYIFIEQERDPQNAGSILDDLAASRSFLAATGY